MMRVKIIDGIYGCRSAKYGVNPVYAGEECEVSAEEAIRLANLGVAIIVGDAEASVPAVATAQEPGDELPQGDYTPGDDNAPAESAGGASEKPLEDMTKADLEEYAASTGIDISACKTKVDIREAIREAEVAGPELGVEAPVV